MSTANLQHADAIEKLKKLAEGIDFALMATKLDQRPLHVIPMSTKQVDESGRIWFLSGKDSSHNRFIQQDGDLQLLYSNPSDMQFLTVFGTATIVTEKSKLEELYGASDDAWFDGIDDPNLSAICVEPSESHYWDTKNNRLVTLFKMAASAVTGEEPDIMDQGKLNL